MNQDTMSLQEKFYFKICQYPQIVQRLACHSIALFYSALVMKKWLFSSQRDQHLYRKLSIRRDGQWYSQIKLVYLLFYFGCKSEIDLVSSVCVDWERFVNKANQTHIENVSIMEQVAYAQRPIIVAGAHTSGFFHAFLHHICVDLSLKRDLAIVTEPPSGYYADYLDKVQSYYQGRIKIIDFKKTSALKECLQVLSGGGVIFCLTDYQSPDNHHEEVSFFGQKHFWPRGILKMAQKFDAIIIPIFSRYQGQQVVLTAQSPLMDTQSQSLPELAQNLATTYEDYIRRHPQHWFGWLFNNVESKSPLKS